MTTLNTIIEEEVMNEIEREVNMLVAECLEARDCSRIANVLETVEEKFTTAMQRAYEVGVKNCVDNNTNAQKVDISCADSN